MDEYLRNTHTYVCLTRNHSSCLPARTLAASCKDFCSRALSATRASKSSHSSSRWMASSMASSCPTRLAQTSCKSSCHHVAPNSFVDSMQACRTKGSSPPRLSMSCRSPRCVSAHNFSEKSWIINFFCLAKSAALIKASSRIATSASHCVASYKAESKVMS